MFKLIIFGNPQQYQNVIIALQDILQNNLLLFNSPSKNIISIKFTKLILLQLNDRNEIVDKMTYKEIIKFINNYNYNLQIEEQYKQQQENYTMRPPQVTAVKQRPVTQHNPLSLFKSKNTYQIRRNTSNPTYDNITNTLRNRVDITNEHSFMNPNIYLDNT